MKVRLLNPNIYADNDYKKIHPKDTSPRDPDSYPVVVDGFFNDLFNGTNFERKSIKVGGDELNRVFKRHFRDGSLMESALFESDASLGWWNDEGNPKAWEPVGPFDFWNKLKSSREVGENVGKGYL